MAGRGDPPEGTPEGVPGGEDEYRSTVFDETFVQGARLQEFSARERMADHEHPVRSRPGPPPARRTSNVAPKQGLVLLLLILLAFGTAIYMGMRNPYQEPDPAPTRSLRTTVIPLVPHSTVPGAEPGELFQHSPAAGFRSGADGVTLPTAKGTRNFSDGQVLAALTIAKNYVVASSLDPDVLTGGTVRSVRGILAPEQHRQFDRSMRKSAADGRHAATGWLVRFAPGEVALADPKVRVRGKLSVTEVGEDALEVTADHVLVYALRPAGAAAAPTGSDGDASLFTVRREVRMHFERDDLRERRLSVEQVAMQAGPLPCTAATHDRLRPMLAGEAADVDRSAGTDPYAQGRSASTCGVLAGAAQPSLPG